MSDRNHAPETKRRLPAYGLHALDSAIELRACIDHLIADAQQRMDERVRRGEHGGRLS